MGVLSSPVSGSVMDFSPFKKRTEDDATHQLGALVELSDERAYRYLLVGATGVSKGKLQQNPAIKANHLNRAISAAVASGGKTAAPSVGATAVVKNEYAEGFMVVNDVDGEGQTYKIAGNDASAGSAAVNIYLYDEIATALTTSSEVSLVHNKHNGVVEVASATRRAVGVPMIDLAAGDFGWGQCKGVAGVLIGTAATLGARLISDGSTAGAVTDNTDVTAPQAEVQVGIANIVAGTSTEYNPITLCIE